MRSIVCERFSPERATSSSAFMMSSESVTDVFNFILLSYSHPVLSCAAPGPQPTPLQWLSWNPFLTCHRARVRWALNFRMLTLDFRTLPSFLGPHVLASARFSL